MPLSVAEMAELLGTLVRALTPLDAAAQQLIQGGMDPAIVDAAVAGIRKQVRGIETLREPRTLRRGTRDGWYPGPRDGDRFWPLLKRYLIDEKDWKVDTIDSIDRSSSRIVSELDFPGTPRFATRGLVLGYVQSGKTASFTAVINKAADVGYKLFIVLSGLTDTLRYQTQERLMRESVDLNPDYWHTWTNVDLDFGDMPFNINALLAEHGQHKHLVVIKKNGYRLRRLRDKLRLASSVNLNACPVLVIDDECDQASVNAAKLDADPTTINRLLIEILSSLPKGAYVGYTATPFANVFIDPNIEKDLYPRDFIVDLERPPDYFGAERLFGRDPLDTDEGTVDDEALDMIRTIEDPEFDHLRPRTSKEKDHFCPTVTPSLERALLYYWMATAARGVRGDGDKHSSMLIHTTVYTAAHHAFLGPLEEFRISVRQRVRRRERSLLSEMEKQWREETEAVEAGEFGRSTVAFDQLLVELEAAIGSTEIVVENSLSEKRLSFTESGRRYIVVGGNVLARGLTIEGLIVSFFLRTSGAYDSLMQMGRWFGYRPNFEDLPRVWMSEEMQGYFRDLATVEQEIRNDIKRYELDGLTPRDLAVRVRTHPHLAITAKNKMLATVPVDVSFAGRLVQTFKFYDSNAVWLRSNWSAGDGLVKAARQDASSASEERSRWLFRDVPAEHVVSFLDAYETHPTHVEFQPDRVKEYVGKQNAMEGAPLSKWNVAVIGSGEETYGDALVCGSPIPLIGRSRFNNAGVPEGTVDIKALVSKADLVIDFEPPAQAGEFPARAELHRARGPGGRESNPLLLLYPIAAASRPKEGSQTRSALGAASDVMGLAIVFPTARHDSPLSYRAVPLPTAEWEEPEMPEMDGG